MSNKCKLNWQIQGLRVIKCDSKSESWHRNDSFTRARNSSPQDSSVRLSKTSSFLEAHHLWSKQFTLKGHFRSVVLVSDGTRTDLGELIKCYKVKTLDLLVSLTESFEPLQSLVKTTVWYRMCDDTVLLLHATAGPRCRKPKPTLSTCNLNQPCLVWNTHKCLHQAHVFNPATKGWD